jgi:curved DNA-binding protein CbpA
VIDRGAGQGNELYRVLGVEPDVAGPELARAYRRKLRQLHPDTSGSSGSADVPEAHPRPDLADVQHAYQVLRDPDRRARYDAQRVQRAAPADARSAAVPPPPVPIRVRVRRVAPARDFVLKVGPVRIEASATWSWGRRP